MQGIDERGSSLNSELSFIPVFLKGEPAARGVFSEEVPQEKDPRLTIFEAQFNGLPKSHRGNLTFEEVLRGGASVEELLRGVERLEKPRVFRVDEDGSLVLCDGGLEVPVFTRGKSWKECMEEAGKEGLELFSQRDYDFLQNSGPDKYDILDRIESFHLGGSKDGELTMIDSNPGNEKYITWLRDENNYSAWLSDLKQTKTNFWRLPYRGKGIGARRLLRVKMAPSNERLAAFGEQFKSLPEYHRMGLSWEDVLSALPSQTREELLEKVLKLENPKVLRVDEEDNLVFCDGGLEVPAFTRGVAYIGSRARAEIDGLEFFSEIEYDLLQKSGLEIYDSQTVTLLESGTYPTNPLCATWDDNRISLYRSNNSLYPFIGARRLLRIPLRLESIKGTQTDTARQVGVIRWSGSNQG